MGKLVDEEKSEGVNLGTNRIFIKVDLTGDPDIIVDEFERYLENVSDVNKSNA